MTYRRTLWLALPALAFAGSYLGSTGCFRRQWSTTFGTAPVAAYSALIELPSQELGSIVEARIDFENRGGSDLLISDFRTNCSCSRLETEENGGRVPVDVLRVPAGTRVETVMRVAARARVGGPMQNLLSFRTNDPTRIAGQIEIVIPFVDGGIVSMPRAVALGDLVLNQTSRNHVDIRDGSVAPRAIQKVVSSDPERIGVRVMSPNEIGPTPPRDLAGVFLGRIEVDIRTNILGPISETIDVFVVGRSDPDRIPVAGRVVAPIEISPRVVVLPRRSGQSRLYESECQCSAILETLGLLTVESLPPGISAEIRPSEIDIEWQTILFTWDPIKGRELDGQTVTARFRARVGDRQTTVEVPIICRAGDG